MRKSGRRVRVDRVQSVLDVRRDVEGDVVSVDSRDERDWGFRMKVDVIGKEREGWRT